MIKCNQSIIAFILIHQLYIPSHCFIEITSEDMCEIQQHLYLIAAAIRIDLQPCKGNLITRHVGTQGVSHGNLSQAATQVSPHATLTLRSIPLVSRAPARVVPDVPAGRLNSREGYISYMSPGAYELRRFTEPHNPACD